MSNAVFPVLPGLGWGVIKTPNWRTKIQQAISGKEYRTSFYSYPIYNIKLTYEILRADAINLELQQLLGFFNSRNGSWDSFLYTDPTDNLITAQSIGVGDGITTQFQLVRAYGGGTEPVMNVNTITGIYDNGAPVLQGTGAGKYTIDSYGFVTFGTVPVVGHVLTWAGTYYYRCRFDSDAAEFDNFMYQLWTLKSCNLIGNLGSKI